MNALDHWTQSFNLAFTDAMHRIAVYLPNILFALLTDFADAQEKTYA